MPQKRAPVKYKNNKFLLVSFFYFKITRFCAPESSRFPQNLCCSGIPSKAILIDHRQMFCGLTTNIMCYV